MAATAPRFLRIFGSLALALIVSVITVVPTSHTAFAEPSDQGGPALALDVSGCSVGILQQIELLAAVQSQTSFTGIYGPKGEEMSTSGPSRHSWNHIGITKRFRSARD